jgi:hypothetical protein
MPASHRLDVAAELLVELVDEDRRAVLADEPPRRPLVPARHHHELRRQLQRPLPLLGEVIAVVHRAG